MSSSPSIEPGRFFHFRFFFQNGDCFQTVSVYSYPVPPSEDELRLLVRTGYAIVSPPSRWKTGGFGRGRSAQGDDLQDVHAGLHQLVFFIPNDESLLQ